VILAMQLGAAPLRDGDRYGNFRSLEFRQALEFYLDLFRSGLAPRGAAAYGSDPYRDFASGSFAFYVTGPWNLGEFARRLPAPIQGRWSTAPMPSPRGDGPGLSLAGGASLAMNAGSAHPDEAWALIEFLSHSDRQIALYHATGDLPARRSAWTAAALESDARTRAFWIQLAWVRPTPAVPEWERIAARVGQHAELAIRGLADVDEVLRRMDDDADLILSKRRSLFAARDGNLTGNPRFGARD
jgi:multiple sugar transport system substrate-binding protein